MEQVAVAVAVPLKHDLIQGEPETDAPAHGARTAQFFLRRFRPCRPGGGCAQDQVRRLLMWPARGHRNSRGAAQWREHKRIIFIPGPELTSIPATSRQGAPSEDEDCRPVAMPESDVGRTAIILPLTILAVVAVIFALHWARAFFIPLLFGVMISYALSPLVNWMQKRRIPRAAAAAILLLGFVGGLGSMAYSLSDEVSETIEAMPKAAQKFRLLLRKERGTAESAMEKVQKATTELENAASDSPSNTPNRAPAGVTRVQIEKPKFDLQEYLWAGTMGATTFGGQVVIVLFLAYFLIVAGDNFRRKLVRINGATFGKRKITLQMLDKITGQIQNYLMVQLFTCSLVGVATWLAFLWVGFDHAAVWGAAAAVLNAIPYLGAVVIAAGTALFGFLQFGTIGMAFAVSGIALGISNLEGLLLTPWLTARTSQMNPAVIFAGVLFWGWLWGIWGLLLGIPIMMAIKAICDHIEDLNPVGDLLGK
ncbi:MAG: AI-2E family transporter [Alphaproteobacteria bacterium]